MKKFDLLTPLCNAALAFLMGLSGIFCLITAMDLPTATGILVFSCLFWAVFPQVILRMKANWLALLGALALWGFFLWRGGLTEDACILVERVATVYHRAYDWGVPDFLQPNILSHPECTHALAAIAGICTLLAGLGLTSRQRSTVLFAALLPVIPCVVVTDTVPDSLWLFILAVCLALVLLSHQVRTVDPRRASRVVTFTLIPTMLCAWLLFYLQPEDQYQQNAGQAQFRQDLMDALDDLPLLEVEDGQICLDPNDIPTLGTAPDWGKFPTLGSPSGNGTLPTLTLDPGLTDILKENISLIHAGPRDPGNTLVMTVSTKYRGTLYLRERGYDIYTGTAWSRTGNPQTMEMDRRYLADRSDVTVRTNRTHAYYFLPYYSLVNAFDLPNGVYENPEEQNAYSFGAYATRSNWQSLWQSTVGASIAQIDEYSQYLALPQDTQDQAAAILRELNITENTNVLTAAQTIKQYVMASATYDLNTSAMPQDGNDFAIWFLTQSDTGYCVHFATAATVLLRAAGIPARYVEGYIVPVKSDTTKVTSDLSHAWVEYYLPQAGWVMLEATPSGEGSPVPVETAAPTAPTTAPTVPTMPTTAPTGVNIPITTAPTAPSSGATTTAMPTTSLTIATSTAAATTVPVTPDVPQQDREVPWTWLSAIFAILGLGCGAYGQWQLRLWLRQQRLRRGNSNQNALAYYQECQKMATLRRQKVPAALRDLAWKAKFSQHTITDAELQCFRAYLQRSVAHLQERPWYLRLVYRLIFAAY